MERIGSLGKRNREFDLFAGRKCDGKLSRTTDVVPTLRGLTAGRIKLVGEEQSRSRCLVVGDCFPTWLLHYSSLGFKLDRVLLKSPRFLELIYQVCGRETAVWSSPTWESLDAVWPHLGKEVVCLLDGRITGGLLNMLVALGIENVYSTDNPRKCFSGWNSIRITVPHT